MRNTVVLVAAVCLSSVSAIAWTAAQQTKPAPSVANTPIEEVLKTVRSDLQSERADIIAKNMTLSSDVAAKFWPMYQLYQTEQNAIMDEQLKGIQHYIESYDTLDDAGATGLIRTHFTRDQKMDQLHEKWFGEFQKVLGTRMAVRAMQIDRRLSLVHQIQFASRIPLAH